MNIKENLFIRKLGQKIQEIRKRTGLTQGDLENFGVSLKHLQKIEAGKTNTTVRMLYRLSTAFQCSIEEFFKI